MCVADDGVEGWRRQYKNIRYGTLDIMLPKMDGYAVCEIIRQSSNVPIIMISALSSETDQIKGFELQIDDYIPKPIVTADD